MSFEKPKGLPEKHELPLNISESEAFEHQGRESEIRKIKAEDRKPDEVPMILKGVRRQELSSMAEMKRSRDFYDFIKQHPRFGKFVLNTLHFTARESAGEEPKAYKLQKALEGRRIDELSDAEIYGNRDVMGQLLEFIDAAEEIIAEANEKGKNTPDLYGDKLMANILYNPRFSSNIFVTDKPDANGQRVFLVDVNIQSQQIGKLGKEYQKNIGSKLQTVQLERWKKKIQERLNETK